MPKFTYRAKDSSLKLIEGAIEADTEASAISRLGRQGIHPVAITQTDAVVMTGRGMTSRRVPRRTLAYATRQLADLLGGGLPLLSALNLLARQTEHRALRGVVESLVTSVREGRAFSEALEDYPQVFPPLYVSMVRAGEVGGALEQTLVRLADLLEAEAEMRSRVLTSAAYPLIVLFFAFGMTIFMVVWVIPQLAKVFVDSQQVLPAPTQFLITTSRIVIQWWWALLGGAVVGGWLLRQWMRSETGKALVDRMLFGIPGIGSLLRKMDTVRFARSLGVLTSQGVPVLQALQVVAQNVASSITREAVLQVEAAVREGSTIADALTATGQFPIFVGNMVAVGEESGTVDAALLKISVAYEREVDRALRTLLTILEPVLLLFVGGIVMFIVLAMLLPILQIGAVVQ